MTPAQRAWLGAALGAILTLALHPLSRPYITSVFVLRAPPGLRFRDEPTTANGHQPDLLDSPLPQAYPPVLFRPQNRFDASVWLQVAAEKLIHHVRFQPDEIPNVIQVSRAASDSEPDNAFWLQMEAVFLREHNELAEAKRVWLRASHCASWNDLQTSYLSDLGNKLAANTQSDFAWQWAFVYYLRSTAAARAIANFARAINPSAGLGTDSGLQLRYATLVNGELLRKGSRNLEVGQIGATMMEIASHPPGLRST